MQTPRNVDNDLAIHMCVVAVDKTLAIHTTHSVELVYHPEDEDEETLLRYVVKQHLPKQLWSRVNTETFHLDFSASSKSPLSGAVPQTAMAYLDVCSLYALFLLAKTLQGQSRLPYVRIYVVLD
jgi:hypothetical protein